MKKISVDTAKNYIKEKSPEGMTKTSMVFNDGQEVEVEIRTKLTTDEKSAFISRVLSGCFDGNGNYRPEYMTPMLRATILQMCTNLPVISRKGEKTEDGEAVMDIDAMDALYVSLNLDTLNDVGYQSMMGEMVHLSGIAADWRKAKQLSGAKEELAYAARSVRELAEALTAKIDGLDLDALMEYAKKLSENTEGLSEQGVIKALVESANEANE